MRYYEMLFIVHPNYELDRLDAVISSVQKEISSKGAKILKTDNWGKRKLSYLINKQRYGSYVLMYFEADPSMIQGLYEWMEIQAQILHQMVIRLEEKPELTDESQNPDYRAAAPSKSSAPKKEEKAKAPVEKPVVEAPAEEVVEVKEEVVETPAEEAVEEVVEESAPAEAPADVPEVVEEAAETATEEVVEEAAADKESASAEATADKKGE